MTGGTLADFRREIEARGLRAAATGWLRRIRESQLADPAIWISVVPEDALSERVAGLEKADAGRLPLYGVPFAVKDNIDALGFPTTAACPAFAYDPVEDAPAVRALLDAGAVCMGKTNMDQFATGLVGTRSPYGTPVNPRAARIIPGGSSSGSAVAVARGLVPFALGTDTAGSGRVPAALCGIHGWKPTRGLVSTRGVVPACRSLDCVSVFANSAADIADLATVLARYDSADPWSRRFPADTDSAPARTLAIPLGHEMEFFRDDFQCRAWGSAIRKLEDAGLVIVRRSFAAFFEAARLLYEGPWVAERYLAIRDLLENRPEEILPVTRAIISAGARPTARDAFAAIYRLAELRRASEEIWDVADAICLPTTGTIYTRAEVEADPVRLNSNLGFYTNFFNLLDLCGLAMPMETREDGLPFGITLAAPAGNDRRVMQTVAGLDGSAPVPPADTDTEPRIELGVFGAHMRGFPLESRLTRLGARFVRTDRTAPVYRMAAFDELRPGVFRASGGGPLDLEVWSVPSAAVGELLCEIPLPLGLAKISLHDGAEIVGFVCEAAAAEGKPDITAAGGWRNYKARAASTVDS